MEKNHERNKRSIYFEINISFLFQSCKFNFYLINIFMGLNLYD